MRTGYTGTETFGSSRQEPAAVSHDPPREHRRPGERVDVTHRAHRAVVQPEQRRLGAVVEQHTDAAARYEAVVGAGGGPYLNVVEQCHLNSQFLRSCPHGTAACQWTQV